MHPVERGLFLPRAKVLAVADLHIGYEFELSRSGVKIPSQTPRMKRRLLDMIDSEKPKELIIVGDLKHNIPYVGDWEFEELERFVRDLPVRVRIIKGNHDVGLSSIIHAENTSFGNVRGEIVGKVGFFHGHTWPRKELLQCRYLVLGHSHPVILLVDRLGVQTRLPCFIEAMPKWEEVEKRYPSELEGYNEKLRVIILPSFNELFGGTAFNVEVPLGPLAKNCLDIPNSKVILLDGTVVGRVKDVRAGPATRRSEGSDWE